MAEMPDSFEFSQDLAQLVVLERQVATQTEATAGAFTYTSVDGKLNELLEKAKAIAAKYHPASMTVTVGVPFGASVSFTWDMPKEGATISG